MSATVPVTYPHQVTQMVTFAQPSTYAGPNCAQAALTLA